MIRTDAVTEIPRRFRSFHLRAAPSQVGASLYGCAADGSGCSHGCEWVEGDDACEECWVSSERARPPSCQRDISRR
eukprot:COSAG01_NODE_21048_length_920_cov_78.096224_1_plen_76_part_00